VEHIQQKFAAFCSLLSSVRLHLCAWFRAIKIASARCASAANEDCEDMDIFGTKKKVSLTSFIFFSPNYYLLEYSFAQY
jgi:hypothetical protein